MAPKLECPACGSDRIDVHDYLAMAVVSHQHALFTLECPSCGTRISSVRPIPEDMLDEVMYAAIEVGAGMGQSR